MSADRLPVHLSRSELHAVEAPASFEATGSFDVELVNHDTAVHVHLNLDEALSSDSAMTRLAPATATKVPNRATTAQERTAVSAPMFVNAWTVPTNTRPTPTTAQR